MELPRYQMPSYRGTTDAQWISPAEVTRERPSINISRGERCLRGRLCNEGSLKRKQRNRMPRSRAPLH